MHLDIDESLSQVERIKRYCQSGISVQRHVHICMLAACAESVGAAATMEELLPLLKPASCDPELSVRQARISSAPLARATPPMHHRLPPLGQALAEQLVRIAKVLLAEPEARAASGTGEATAYNAVTKEIVPLLSALVGIGGAQDQNSAGVSQVVEAASAALIEVAGLLPADDVGPSVLAAVLCLAHDNESEENRVVATHLLGSLAPGIASELRSQFVVPDVISLADDPGFRVRKAAALKIGGLCGVVGPEIAISRLLPVYEALAHDEIWGVRKASVDSLAEVASVMPLDVRTGTLAPLLHEFHEDGSRWVRISACQALGPFLATLPSEHISAELLALFTQLANPANPNASDSDIAYYCAYNFPGVVQAMGAGRWTELADAFRTLATNIQWKVRKTLAYALHELAAILGTELAESELLPTFSHFLKDLDEVKVGVIQNVCRFLAVLSEGARRQHLHTLVEIRAERDNWRFRHMLASQLAHAGEVFPHADVVGTLVPLALELCTDAFAEVRVAAIAQAGPLLAGAFRAEPQPLADESPLAKALKTIRAMANAPSCYTRSNFAHICASLAASLESGVFVATLLPGLEPLATDRVANVRLAVARTVKQHMLTSEVYASLAVTEAMAASLRADRDRDVLYEMHGDDYEPPPYRSRHPTPAATEGVAPLGAAPAPTTEPAAGASPLGAQQSPDDDGGACTTDSTSGANAGAALGTAGVLATATDVESDAQPLPQLAPLADAIDAIAEDGAGCAAPSGADVDETIMATGPDPIRSGAEMPPRAASTEECRLADRDGMAPAAT